MNLQELKIEELQNVIGGSEITDTFWYYAGAAAGFLYGVSQTLGNSSAYGDAGIYK